MEKNKEISNNNSDEIEENNYTCNGFYYQTNKKNYGIWYKKVERDGGITEIRVTNFLIKNVTLSTSDTNKKDERITYYNCEIHNYNDFQRITLDTNGFTKCRIIEKMVTAFSILILDDKLYRKYLSNEILDKEIEKISDSSLNEKNAIQFLRDLFEVFKLNEGDDFEFFEGNRFILNTREWGQLFQDKKPENNILQKQKNVYGATFTATDIKFIGIKLDETRKYMFDTGLDEYKRYRDRKICDSIKRGLNSLNLLKCSSGFTYEYTFNQDVYNPVKGRFTAIKYLEAKKIIEQEELKEKDNKEEIEESNPDIENENLNIENNYYDYNGNNDYYYDRDDYYYDENDYSDYNENNCCDYDENDYSDYDENNQDENYNNQIDEEKEEKYSIELLALTNKPDYEMLDIDRTSKITVEYYINKELNKDDIDYLNKVEKSKEEKERLYNKYFG